MVNFFWRTLHMYTPRYQSLVRIESLDFDPMVNRYFEAQYVQSGTSESNSQSAGTVENSMSGSNSVTTTDSFKEYPKTVMEVTTEGSSSDVGTDILGSTEKSTVYNNLRDTNAHTGTITDAGNTNATDSTSNSKTEGATTNVTGSTDGKSKSANKTAPMSAVNAGGGTGDGDLANLDFTYATGYAQTDTETSSTTGTTTSGSSTENGSATRVSNDTNIKTMANTDTSTRTGSVTESTTPTTNTSEKTNESASTTTTSYANGSVIEREDTNTVVGTNGGSNTSESESSTSGTTVSNQNSTNRYTGREGLTPQEAMMSASDYLMNYSTAFRWLCRKLDSCFNFNYDV